MYPRLIINAKKIAHNIDYITKLCHQKDISVMGVTKAICAHPDIIEIFENSRLDYIADSRLENLMYPSKKMKVLLRVSMPSEARMVVNYTDISLQSSLETIKILQKAAFLQKKKHAIILMFDIGDLREGLYYTHHYMQIVEKIMSFNNIDLVGIGTNLTCYGGVLPTPEIMKRLSDIAKAIEEKFAFKLQIISGGNSSSFEMLRKEELVGINNLRFGELIFLGRETAYSNDVEELYQDAFTLEAEVIEHALKPSVPDGQLGVNAFGEKVVFEDKGLIHRMILGIGRQEVRSDDIVPLDNDLEIIGSSSDHLLVNDLLNKYKVGDIISFKLSYGGLLGATTSKYVKKELVYE